MDELVEISVDETTEVVNIEVTLPNVGGGLDGNDFVTGGFIDGNFMRLNIPNQAQAVIDVSALVGSVVGGTMKEASEYNLLPSNTASQNVVALRAIIAAHIAGEFNVLIVPSGVYLFNDSSTYNNVSGLFLLGMMKTIFRSVNEKSIFDTRDDENRVDSISFKSIHFENIHVAPVDGFDITANAGIFFFGKGQLSNVYFEDCTFTAPNCEMNGFKTANETVAGSSLIRFTKNIVFNRCRFFDIGRMGVELFTDPSRDPSLFGVVFLDCEFDGMGLIKATNGMGASIAGVGHGVYTRNCTFKRISQIGFENIGMSNVHHDSPKFLSDTGRMFGFSNTRKMKNIRITNYVSDRVPPTGVDVQSYFQNVDDVILDNCKFQTQVNLGGTGDINNFQIINSDLYGEDSFGVVKFAGVIDGFRLYNTKVKSNSNGNPVFITEGDTQTNILMEGGSIDRLSGIQLNTSGGASVVQFRNVHDTDDGISQGFINDYLGSGFDFSADNLYSGNNSHTGVNVFSNDLLSAGSVFSILIDGRNGQGPNIQFGQNTDYDQYGKWGVFGGAMNVNATDRDLYLHVDNGGSILIDKQTNRVGIGFGNAQPTAALDVNGTIKSIDTIEATGASSGVVLASPDGTRFRISVANDGTVSAAAV